MTRNSTTRPSTMKRRLPLIWAMLLLGLLAHAASSRCASSAEPGSTVTFNEQGIALVDGRPFFPVGVFLYSLDEAVLAEVREVQCNTVVQGFRLDQLDLLHANGLKAICQTDRASIGAAKDHPALLAWYLTDEPENRGVTPAGERERYLALKAEDPRHPVGQCHTAFEALTTFKDSCDFTMTDIYPITPQRDQNIMGVSIMMDEARRIHGPNWPHWTDVQTFGGPEADGGVWAVPLPHELRFMVYQALVHRATGILYFSYWPQAPRTWQEVGRVNRELHQLIPYLVAPGREGKATADDPRIETRVKLVEHDDKIIAGMIMAINTSRSFVDAEVTIDPKSQAPNELSAPFRGETVTTADGRIRVSLAPYGEQIYLWAERRAMAK